MSASAPHVVIVTYNGERDIVPCLSSVFNSSIPVDVTIVDNASTDATVEIVKRQFPKAGIIRLAENLGFGRGNNIGIKHAYKSGAENLFLLNQDASVEPDTIRLLVEIQKANEDYVLISPMHLDGPGKQLDKRFAAHLSTALSMGKFLSDVFLRKQLAVLYDVEFLNAAAWMLSRRCVERVGLFNPIFEHYGEDSEYAHRTLQKGFKFGLVTQAVIFHNRRQIEINCVVDGRKMIMMEKALIRYRLCRKNPGTAKNILSALTRAIFASGQNTSESMLIKAQLLGFILGSLRQTIRARDNGYVSKCAFFDSTPDGLIESGARK